jgi:hypothetical protein
MSKMRAPGLGLMVVAALAGCYGADTADEEGAPYSATLVSDLTVGGYRCPSSGEIAVRTRPADNLYYLTTFGGGSDNQRMACFGYADGRWLYIADSWRFGCRSRVKLTNPRTGRWCVTQVADVGPNICVERAAGKAIIDASPAVSRELYGIGSAGWSDRVVVRAELVAATTPVGCGGASSTPVTPPPGQNGGRTCYSTTWGRDMSLGACVQSRSDRTFYQCTNLGWVTSSGITASRTGPGGPCTTYLPLNS